MARMVWIEKIFSDGVLSVCSLESGIFADDTDCAEWKVLNSGAVSVCLSESRIYMDDADFAS